MKNPILIITLFLLLLSSCIFSGEDEVPVPAPPEIVRPEPTPEPSPAPPLYNPEEYTRFTEIFFDIFDTLIIIIGYTQSEEEFHYYARGVIREEMVRLHQLFNRFDEFEGISNIRTINDNAGIHPVEVDPTIIEMLQFSIEAYQASQGTVNIAIGPVTDIWREYIGERRTTRPSAEALRAAGELTNINNVIINEANNTVFLRYEGMSLDVGGIAKGYAIELAVQKALDAGFEAFTLSVGGDNRTAGGPRGGEFIDWGIGVENPNGGDFLSIIRTTHNAVFSSADNQRFFYVDEVRYHHIIDPRTFMPATNFRSVTVIHPDAGIADVLTTAAFVLELDEAKEIIHRFGAQALWLLPDGTVVTTEGYSRYGTVS